jgi:hypothetical protein
MIKLLYKPVGMLVSVVGGLLAGAILKKIWKVAAGEKRHPGRPMPGEDYGRSS